MSASASSSRRMPTPAPAAIRRCATSRPSPSRSIAPTRRCGSVARCCRRHACGSPRESSRGPSRRGGASGSSAASLKPRWPSASRHSCTPAVPTRRDVVLGIAGEPRAILSDEPSAQILQAAVTESLVRRDPDGGFVARLATEVPTIANGGARIVTDAATPGGRLVATFELRSDARWQDGEPITADDVRFAFDDDRTAPLTTARRWMSERVERVERINDRTVRFTYRAGERWDLYPLVARVLPAHVLAGVSADKRMQYLREPMHAGPFAVAAWIPGFGMTLSAFPSYVGGAPSLGRIEVRFYSDRGAVVDALRRGEVDVAGAPAAEADLTRTLDRCADGPRLQALYKAANAIEMLRFGTKNTVFADLRVRQAVELALDRRALVETIFAGRARVPRSYLVAPLWAATEPLDAPHLDR